MKKRVKSIIKISSLVAMICLGGPLYAKASSVPVIPLQPAPSVKANEVVKSETADKANDKETPAAAPVKSIPELEKEVSNIKGRNDEMNEKVLRANAQIIETLKKLKNKKGMSKRKIRLFNKNEEAIAGKLDGLSKLIEGLKENADKISVAEKKLSEPAKSETAVKHEDRTVETKSSDKATVNTDNKDAKPAETVDPIVAHRNQLESLVWLQLDRNRLLLQIFDSLSGISELLP